MRHIRIILPHTFSSVLHPHNPLCDLPPTFHVRRYHLLSFPLHPHSGFSTVDCGIAVVFFCMGSWSPVFEWSQCMKIDGDIVPYAIFLIAEILNITLSTLYSADNLRNSLFYR